MKEAPPNRRIQQIKTFRPKQAATAANQLDPEGPPGVAAMDRSLRATAQGPAAGDATGPPGSSSPSFPPKLRHRMALTMLFQHWQRVGTASLAVQASGGLAALRGGLSPPTRAAGSAVRGRQMADRGRVDGPGVAATSGGPATAGPCCPISTNSWPTSLNSTSTRNNAIA